MATTIRLCTNVGWHQIFRSRAKECHATVRSLCRMASTQTPRRLTEQSGWGNIKVLFALFVNKGGIVFAVYMAEKHECGGKWVYERAWLPTTFATGVAWDRNNWVGLTLMKLYIRDNCINGKSICTYMYERIADVKCRGLHIVPRGCVVSSIREIFALCKTGLPDITFFFFRFATLRKICRQKILWILDM